MPEIKNTFSQGKMNKDFDERLVPKGEYRDAMNIEVATSEGSEVGTIQSIKGNSKLPISSAISLGSDEKCTGVYRDESNNCAYFFLTNSTPHSRDINPTPAGGIITYRDSIWRLSHSNTNIHTLVPIVVDSYLQQHPIESSGSYGGVSFTTVGDDYTKVTLQSSAGIEVGMWLFISGGGGGIPRYVQSVQGNVISFASDPISIAAYNYAFQGTPSADLFIQFSVHYPNIHGNVDVNTLQYPNRFLRFDNNKDITGINVLDDFLFFTDNFSEPKKINIKRCLLGTHSGGLKTTNLLISDGVGGNTNYGFLKEENVTVIKKSPNKAPDLEMSGTRRTGNLSCNIPKRFKTTEVINGRVNLSINSNADGDPDYRPGDILLLGVGSVSLNDFDAKIKVISINGSAMIGQVITFPTAFANVFKVYKVLLVDSEKPLFENKFVRFGVRWKYVDGEYSNFSPFSNAAFLPNDFSYDTLDAYNIGMTNKLKSLKLKNFVENDMPSDVVEIDILCKESDSPIVYSVDTISETDQLRNGVNAWNFATGSNNSSGKYVIESENIYGALPSNQILRPFDNVPRRAKSQEIVGNRLVYGNYLQNYNLIYGLDGFGTYIKPKFSVWSQGKALYSNELLLNPYVLPLNVNNGTSAQGWNWDDDVDVANNKIGWQLIDYYEFWYLGGGFQNYDYLGTQYELTEFKKIWQTLTGIKKNTSYKIEFRITNYSKGELQGPYLLHNEIIDSSTGAQITFIGSPDGSSYAGRYYDNGHYSVIVNTNKDVGSNDPLNPSAFDNFATNGKTFFFQARNGRGGNKGVPGGFVGEVSHFSVKEVYPSNKESVKSDRNYQLGIVYSDDFGRQTPVLTDTTASFRVGKDESLLETAIVSKLYNNAPSFAGKFKYFIKDTSSEYYNIAVDRGYQAEDNQVWLSFPSSERNKVSEESYISLKKEHNSDTAVLAPASYKIISIENEAPEYIKIERLSLATVTGSLTSQTNLNGVFGLGQRRPLAETTLIAVNSSTFVDEAGLNLQNDLDLINKNYQIQFYSDSFLSGWYDINNISTIDINGTDFSFLTLGSGITTQDASYIVNETGSNVTAGGVTIFPGNMYPDIKVAIAKSDEKTNLSEFVGKFFVKIRSDEFISRFLLAGATSSVKIITASSRSWYLSDAATGVGNQGVQLGTENLTTYFALENLNASPSFHELNGTYRSSDSTLGTEHVNKDIVTFAPQALTSAFSPFSGAITYSSIGNEYPWVLRGSEGARLKWDRLLKFTLYSGWTLGGGSSEQRAEFFIDNVGYVGVMPEVQFPSNGYWVDHGVFDHSKGHDYYRGTDIANLDFGPAGELFEAWSNSNIGNGINSGGAGFETNCRYGRGIFIADGFETDIDGVVDPFFEDGKSYMELGFSRINSTSNTKNIPAANYNTPANWENAWAVGSAANEAHDEEKFFVDKLKKGNKFRFSNDPSETVYVIKKIKTEKRFNHTPYPGETHIGGGDPYAFTKNAAILSDPLDLLGTSSTGYKTFTWDDLGAMDNTTADPTSGGDTYVLANYKFGTYPDPLNSNVDARGMVNVDTDGYSGRNIALDGPRSWNHEKARFGLASNRRLTWIMEIEAEDNVTSVDHVASHAGHANNFDHNSGVLIEFVAEDKTADDVLTSSNPAIFETLPKQENGLDIYYAASEWFKIQDHGSEHILPFYNCYSFGNGVESNRINDDFNTKVLDIDPIASTTIKAQYLEDRRQSGLIFSGIYNSNSDVNDLNQFISAENITKDLNPTYGSIQKLYTRNSDLIALCEEKVIKILANKDALFNANGNSNLLSKNLVLGQSIPFAGEFGISTNPKSFATENYRVYFTDKQKGAVLRLSMDGISVISDYGMTDWFKDELKKATDVTASYDRNKNEYNVTLTGGSDGDYTVSYSEKVKGWTSFKSFIPDIGVSISNNYYTVSNEVSTDNSYVWLHSSNTTQNSFYGKTPAEADYSSVTFILNENPEVVKNFKTLKYEGSQSYINSDTGDGDYYNLVDVKGWKAASISTNLQTGEVDEFLDKEGMWCNYIKGDTTYWTSTTNHNIDTSESTVQGLGIITSHTTAN
tara:strand:+ start:263 stop:6454 length:6192 start_codon:yes stop_codon:yes gene_type:complete